MESPGDEKWWGVFQDPVLQQLIRTALEQNYDLRIAASRVLQAQAQLGITRANQFPTVSADRRFQPTQSEDIGLISILRGEGRRGGSCGRVESRFLGKIPAPN
jgi:outer membrane protein TolC